MLEMFDMLMEPTKKFVMGGIDAFRKSKEHQNLMIAVQDRIRREVRFNSAILQEFKKHDKNTNAPKYDKELRSALLKSLRTEAFDDMNQGMLPLALFFEGEIDKDVIFPNWAKQERYLDWLRNVVTQYDLLERIYHRIRLVKTFAECGEIQGEMDYIHFMLIGLEKSIANTSITHTAKSPPET
jgi:hypothetical protein